MLFFSKLYCFLIKERKRMFSHKNIEPGKRTVKFLLSLIGQLPEIKTITEENLKGIKKGNVVIE